MAADTYLRPQSDTQLALKQNYLITLMFQVDALADELATIQSQIVLDGVDVLAAQMGYTGVNAEDNATAAQALLASMISTNLTGFYAQMLGRMGG